MSWDKNTLNFSEIDATINVLKDIGETFLLDVLGEVQGSGLNDEQWIGEGEDAHPTMKLYPIRKLIYKNTVMLEQMQRHPDCDIDDVILSFKFIIGQEPQDWQIEITIPDPDYDQNYDYDLE